MAEIFSIVASALNIAALFNNCVDCFEYIQLGRHFGRDYQRCQLRLNIAKARLARWGQAVNIDEDPRFATDLPTDESVRLARSILEEVMLLFLATYKASKRYEVGAEQQDLVLSEEEDIKPALPGLHNRLQAFAHRRQKNTSLAKKTAWALYDGKTFERMVDQITCFVNDLEALFPVETTCRRLAEIEIERVEDEPSLVALKDAADDIDMPLNDAVVRKLERIRRKNSAKNVIAEDHARVQVGHQFSEAALSRMAVVTDQTTNTVDTVSAKAESRVQIGNRFGGWGVLDECLSRGLQWTQSRVHDQSDRVNNVFYHPVARPSQ